MHRKLLVSLLSAKGENPSWATLNEENWQVPRDLSSWKEMRAKLADLTGHLDHAHAALDVILEDPVGLEALRYAAERKKPAPNIPNILKAFFELHEVAQDAASIKGKSGNRPHPEWMHEATKRCEVFWEFHKHDKPTGYFNPVARPKKGQRGPSGITAPANAFSTWFCDVMNAVAKLTPSQCETLLRGRSR